MPTAGVSGRGSCSSAKTHSTAYQTSPARATSPSTHWRTLTTNHQTGRRARRDVPMTARSSESLSAAVAAVDGVLDGLGPADRQPLGRVAHEAARGEVDGRRRSTRSGPGSTTGRARRARRRRRSRRGSAVDPRCGRDGDGGAGPRRSPSSNGRRASRCARTPRGGSRARPRRGRWGHPPREPARRRGPRAARGPRRPRCRRRRDAASSRHRRRRP